METNEKPDTLVNLMKCYNHQSNIRCLYEIYSKTSLKEGEPLISRFFKNLAQKKKQHVYWIVSMLKKFHKWNKNQILMKLQEKLPKIGNTVENLEEAFKIQDYEWRILFFNLSNTALEEGYSDIASRLKIISENERKSFEQCKIFLNFFEDGALNKKQNLNIFECQSCGFQIYDLNLPEDWTCPICGHMKSYFQEKTLNIKSVKDTIWECMECGEEVIIEELPEDWNCIQCGRSKEYFRKKSSDINSVTFIDLSLPTWICMECGNEVNMEELPEDWKCISCGKPKAYFKRKPKSGPSNSEIRGNQEKAIWFCPSCGSEIKIDLPNNWKCPICGSKGN